LASQIAEYSLKFTSLTYTPGRASSTVILGNVERTGTGFGTIQGTLTAVGGKSGTLTIAEHHTWTTATKSAHSVPVVMRAQVKPLAYADFHPAFRWP